MFTIDYRAVYLRSHLNKLSASGYLSNPFSLYIMYPTDGIRSQLEWNSALSTSTALPTDDQSRHHRKVRCLFFSLISSQANTTLDLHHRHYRYPRRLKNIVLFSNHILGPKVNTVEKLAELRRAGINVGMCVRRITFLLCFHSCSPYELLPWVI